MLAHRRLVALLCAAGVAGVAGAVACGSRTGLLAIATEGPDGSNDTFRADASSPRDARAPFDAGPPLDALPPIDVATTPPPNDCPDAAVTLIYAITSLNSLLSFDPRSYAFTRIGTLACPGGSSANSMAVDHLGTAYVNFNDGHLFRVSTRTAACQPTAFAPPMPPLFSGKFGMGFAADATSPTGETLFVAENFAPTSRLATIDTTSFALHVVGTFAPAIPSPELTGTGAGGLFAFFSEGSGSAIGQVAEATGQVIGQSSLPGVVQGNGWAFAFWGGDFYTFTAPPVSASSIVTRFRPSDGTIVQVASYGETIVGAGVSTCAPQQ